MSALRPSFVVPSNGAAGTIYYTLKLSNSGTTCTVPPVAVRGYNASTKAPVGPWSSVISTSTTGAVATHGHAADVNIGVTETANWPAPLCKPATVTTLLVAESQKRSSFQTVNIAVSVCTVTRSLRALSPTLTPGN